MRNRFDEPLDHIALVENRELNGDARPVLDFGRGRRNIFRISKIVVDQPVAMKPIDRQDKQHDEVGNHHREIEGVCVIDSRKSLIRDLVPVMTGRILCREGYPE